MSDKYLLENKKNICKNCFSNLENNYEFTCIICTDKICENCSILYDFCFSCNHFICKNPDCVKEYKNKMYCYVCFRKEIII